jgi:hypothetical protein
MSAEIPHCSVDHDWSCESPKLRFADGGRFMQLRFARSSASAWNADMFGDRGGVRGVCKGFSFGSRRRMLNRLNSVSVAAALPYFLTMTLPDEVFCDDVGEFARRAKRWQDAFTKRLVRACSSACGFWRIEWQARKSGAHVGKLFPHFHLLVWGLRERKVGERVRESAEGMVLDEFFEAFVQVRDNQMAWDLLNVFAEASRGVVDCKARVETSDGSVFAGSCGFIRRCNSLMDGVALAEHGLRPELGKQMGLQDWASLVWYHVVDSHNVDHARAGVRVERVRSWGGVMSYCAKYMAKADCQFLSEVAFGRSWGIFNRACMPWAKIVEIDLDQEVGVRLRRVARRYLENRFGRRVVSPYGITLYCDVSRVRRLWERGPPDPF